MAGSLVISWDPWLSAFWVASPFQNFPSLIKWEHIQHLITHPKIVLGLLILKKNHENPKCLKVITKNGLDEMVLSMTSCSSISPTWTPVLFDLIILSFGNISLEKIWEAVSYLVLVWVIAAKEPVLSISGEGWGARVDHEAPGNGEKQGGEDLLVVEPPVAAVPEEVSLAILPLQGCIHVARQAPPFPDVLTHISLY